MHASGKRRPARRAFTLVEMLIVVVIIAMLAGLMLAAAGSARTKAQETVIKTEISQLEMALHQYKTEVGELPPDFAGIDPRTKAKDPWVNDFPANEDLKRHVRRRFPRFNPGSGWKWDHVGKDPPPPHLLIVKRIENAYAKEYNDRPDTTDDIEVRLAFDRGSALAFWLGGLPETIDSTVPAGFHADPSDPFKPGRPRTKSFYEFDAGQMLLKEPSMKDPNVIILRCYYRPANVTGAPFVYFRSRRHPGTGQHTYDFPAKKEGRPWSRYESAWEALTLDADHPGLEKYASAIVTAQSGFAVPYAKAVVSKGAGEPTVATEWANEGSFQIICPGLDGEFGTAPKDQDRGLEEGGVNMTDGDYDNLSNFLDGRVENELN